jgi:hypothetical protein
MAEIEEDTGLPQDHPILVFLLIYTTVKMFNLHLPTANSTVSTSLLVDAYKVETKFSIGC